MRGTPLALLLLFVAAGFAGAQGGAGAAPYRLFDAHIHYSKPDWDVYSPERVLSILAGAGIVRAIVSSTPDDGTLELYRRAPAGIVAFLRPYRTPADMSTWTRDPAVQAYVEQRLASGVYRGIGESHFGIADVGAPVVRRFAELAAQRDLFLQCHVDAATIDRMATTYPSVKLLWAHAGMSADPTTVGRLLDRWPRLWVELSIRDGDVAPGGRLDPAWRALFERHPDRFMVGTDTWTTSRWERVRDNARREQHWLGQLAPDVAAKIAFDNGDRLFPPSTGAR